jgi:hypothetical protein
MTYPVQDLVLILIDGADYRSQMRFHISPDSTRSDAQDLSDDIATKLEAVIDGRVVEAYTVQPLTVPDFSGQAIWDQSDIENGAQFNFAAEDGSLFHTIVPTIDSDFILPNSKLIDLENEQVLDLIAAILLVHTTCAACAADGSNLDHITTAKQHFVSTRLTRHA